VAAVRDGKPLSDTLPSAYWRQRRLPRYSLTQPLVRLALDLLCNKIHDKSTVYKIPQHIVYRDVVGHFGQTLTFGGLLYRPLLPRRAKFGVLEQTHGLRLQAKFRLDRFILSSSGGETPQILLTSAFFDVAI